MKKKKSHRGDQFGTDPEINGFWVTILNLGSGPTRFWAKNQGDEQPKFTNLG